MNPLPASGRIGVCTRIKEGTEILEGQAAFDRFKNAVKTIMAVPKIVVQKTDKAAASGKKTRPK